VKGYTTDWNSSRAQDENVTKPTVTKAESKGQLVKQQKQVKNQNASPVTSASSSSLEPCVR